jgi:hypothetical protein
VAALADSEAKRAVLVVEAGQQPITTVLGSFEPEKPLL